MHVARVFVSRIQEFTRKNIANASAVIPFIGAHVGFPHTFSTRHYR